MTINIPDEVKYIAAVLIPMLLFQWFIMNWAYNEGLHKGFNRGYESGWKDGDEGNNPLLSPPAPKDYKNII